MGQNLLRIGVRAGWLCCLLLAASAGLADPPPQAFRDPLVDGRICSLCPEMVPVPPGRFMLGSLPGEGHNDEHGPDQVPRAVDVRYRFAVGRGEVSRREFAAFVAARPEAEPGAGCAGLVDGVFGRGDGLSWRSPGFPQQDDHPVVCVRWDDAVAYADWLSTITGKAYRLLTEAEWEYVARAGSFTRYWWGEQVVPSMANCLGRACGEDHVATVGIDAFEANRFGLRNLAGNVWEWVADCYLADAYRRMDHAYPRALRAGRGCKRVIRGGSWQDGAWSLRSANRDAWSPEVPLNDVGFRVARIDPDIPL